MSSLPPLSPIKSSSPLAHDNDNDNPTTINSPISTPPHDPPGTNTNTATPNDNRVIPPSSSPPPPLPSIFSPPLPSSPIPILPVHVTPPPGVPTTTPITPSSSIVPPSMSTSTSIDDIVNDPRSPRPPPPIVPSRITANDKRPLSSQISPSKSGSSDNDNNGGNIQSSNDMPANTTPSFIPIVSSLTPTRMKAVDNNNNTNDPPSHDNTTNVTPSPAITSTNLKRTNDDSDINDTINTPMFGPQRGGGGITHRSITISKHNNNNSDANNVDRWASGRGSISMTGAVSASASASHNRSMINNPPSPINKLPYDNINNTPSPPNAPPGPSIMLPPPIFGHRPVSPINGGIEGNNNTGGGSRIGTTTNNNNNNNHNNNTKGKKKESVYTAYLVMAIVFAAIGGLLLGYDIGVIGGVSIMDDFRKTMGFQLKIHGEKDPTHVAMNIGWVVSCLTLGCIVSSLFAGTLVDKVGRRIGVAIGAGVFTCGALIQGTSPNLYVLFIGRSIAGIAIGILSLAVPLWSAELSPASVRGSLGTCQQIAITFGIVVSFLVNLLFASTPSGWRFSLSAQSIFSVILLLGTIILPESPRWLIQHNRYNDAKKVLSRLRPQRSRGQIVANEAEYEEMKAAVEEEAKLGKGQWNELFKSRPSKIEQLEHERERRLSGGTNIIHNNEWNTMNNTTTTGLDSIKSRGQDDNNNNNIGTPTTSSSSPASGVRGAHTSGRGDANTNDGITSSGNAITSLNIVDNDAIPNSSFEENVRFRLFVGVALQFCQQLTGINAVMYYAPIIFSNLSLASLVANLVVGLVNFCSTFIALWLVDRIGRRPLLLAGACGMVVCLVAAGVLIMLLNVSVEPVIGMVVVVLICLYVLNFAYSWGPICWIIPSEIFPLRLRGKCMSMTTTANWTGNFLIALATPMLLSHLGTGWTFIIFAGFGCLMFAFILTMLPETRGRSLESMDELFRSHKWSACGDYVKSPLATNNNGAKFPSMIIGNDNRDMIEMARPHNGRNMPTTKAEQGTHWHTKNIVPVDNTPPHAHISDSPSSSPDPSCYNAPHYNTSATDGDILKEERTLHPFGSPLDPLDDRLSYQSGISGPSNRSSLISYNSHSNPNIGKSRSTSNKSLSTAEIMSQSIPTSTNDNSRGSSSGIVGGQNISSFDRVHSRGGGGGLPHPPSLGSDLFEISPASGHGSPTLDDGSDKPTSAPLPPLFHRDKHATPSVSSPGAITSSTQSR